MFRALFRLIVILVVLGVATAFFIRYRGTDKAAGTAADPIAGAAGSLEERTERAREAGARIGEQVARSAERATDALEEGRLTAKIKSKIALDDTLDGTSLSVTTDGNVVTLAGRVSTAAQHRRVLQLASETEGVGRIVDHVSVK
jgi:osmotically-inducible protein OsmY